MNGSVTIELGGEELVLLPGRAVLRPSTGELLVSDLHLGKEDAFRHAGRPLPDGASGDDLVRLAALLRASGATRLTVLGDLTHHVLEQDSRALAELGAWLQEHAAWHPRLVSGNHDRHAADRVAGLGLRVVDEPHAAGGMSYLHAPPADVPDAASWLAGHVHPGQVLSSKTDRLRVPIFHLCAGRGLVLPAFGGFTGLQILEPPPADRTFAAGDEAVVEIPGAGSSAIPRR